MRRPRLAKRPLEDAPQVEVLNLHELRAWLKDNHTTQNGVWLVHHKKASANYIDMGDIVDELLCWGWIDSLSRGKDELRTMHYIAPRNPKSNWSRVNKDKIDRLAAAERLQSAGRAMVDLAKTTGTWSALDDVRNPSQCKTCSNTAVENHDHR